MSKVRFLLFMAVPFFIAGLTFLIPATPLWAGDKDKPKGPPPMPVEVAVAEQRMVSDQVSLVGTTAAVADSTVAAEVSGVVEKFPVKEGDFVKKGSLLVQLSTTELKIRLKGAVAAKGTIRAKLENAKKDLDRYTRLKDTDSVAARNYDEAFYNYQALSQQLLGSEADIERLKYEIDHKNVVAPFSGFVAKEHTQVGEWINLGGPVVDLVDLGKIKVLADVPERYAVKLSPREPVKVTIASISNVQRAGRIYALLPQANPDARTFPVEIYLENPGFKIKSGMEAMATFSLTSRKTALVVPKDALVLAGDKRMVFAVIDGKAVPMPVKILAYYDGDVAVEGQLAPGIQVVIRGNERLRPGQPVVVQK